MNAPLYTTEILRLAASVPDQAPLERIDGMAEERSPTCGSTVLTQVQIDSELRVVELRQEVRACAFGQASAALVAAHARGRSHADVCAAVADLGAWLASERADPGSWPGLTALAPARSRAARHGAILLPFKALANALESCRV